MIIATKTVMNGATKAHPRLSGRRRVAVRAVLGKDDVVVISAFQIDLEDGHVNIRRAPLARLRHQATPRFGPGPTMTETLPSPRAARGRAAGEVIGVVIVRPWSVVTRGPH